MAKIPASIPGPINKKDYNQSSVPIEDPNRPIGTEGVNNSYIVEANPLYNQAEQEKVISSPNNTYIILGRDRPGSLDTGKGGQGNTHCGTIDLVAGLSGMLAREIDPETKESVLTNKNIMLDAARIYISQRTDVDENFKISEGIVGSPKNRSAIAIKADGIRIVAREGIKLVTGTDTYNSQGVKTELISGIDLMAGNDSLGLQPLVKGENLSLFLSDIVEIIGDLNGIVQGIIKQQLQSYAALITHIHIAPPAGPTSPSPGLATFLAKELPSLGKLMFDCVSVDKNSVMVKLNYNNPLGRDYINSQFNNTN